MQLIELSIGHCRSDGSILPSHKIALAELRSLIVFSKCFRGTQVYHPLGAYLTSEDCLVIESSTVLRATAQEVESHLQELRALCHELVNTLEQESVLLTIFHVQGTMHWIESEAPAPAGKQPALTSPLTLYAETL
jgi:hypothetical protein